jgi:hypothetical protein
MIALYRARMYIDGKDEKTVYAWSVPRVGDLVSDPDNEHSWEVLAVNHHIWPSDRKVSPAEDIMLSLSVRPWPPTKAMGIAPVGVVEHKRD